LLLISLLTGGCNPIAQQQGTTPFSPLAGTEVSTIASTAAPFPTQTPRPMPTAEVQLQLWISPGIPDRLAESLSTQTTLNLALERSAANIWLEPSSHEEALFEWVYSLVVPFSSLIEEFTFEELQSLWAGSPTTELLTIFISQDSADALEPVLGKPSSSTVIVVPSENLLESAWQRRDVLAIVPFEDLEPRWKVISLAGQSPISNQFDAAVYPLTVRYQWGGDPAAVERVFAILERGELTLSTRNRDPERLTVLVMTGVTALVRATAVRMEEKGMTYPAGDILHWLRDADLTHINNEVSFSPRCPDPSMAPYPLIFCSKPEYIELLDYIGTDILELTGNHGVDWGRDALLFSLDLYQQRGWVYFAAGVDEQSARDAVFIEHNGNHFAFLGCNPAGPEYIWADEDTPGVANCDYSWIQERIRQLREEGYLVIFTFQYFETYRHWVLNFEKEDFRKPADAGAVIVSGSQAHHPMAMEFYGDSFIHYGLGNLFFDQMWVDTVTIPKGTRKEFIDRHVFYDGKHISTELLTAYLEDYSRPRPMTAAERRDFLQAIFTAAGWGPYQP
jgi:poly-gamma-glutamate synthesis protein (capsule biosynthesis protein)